MAVDEHFEYFLEKMGPSFDRRYVPPSTIERYRGKLPERLFAYWSEYGWCGYADGQLWTVDPTEYEPVVDAWLGDTPFMERDAYHVIARGAFGNLYFFGERTGSRLSILVQDAIAMDSGDKTASDLDLEAEIFFSSRSRGSNDLSDLNGDKLFDRALKKLGRLKPGEMYGFEPALALGGPATLDHLHKVKAVEHLVMLAQLAPLRVMNVSL